MRRLVLAAGSLALLGGLLGCGIKGSPKPPVQVVTPAEPSPSETPPRPGREQTGVADRSPFPPADVRAPGQMNPDAGPLPVPLDGGVPLVPAPQPVPDAPAALAPDAGAS